MKKMQKHVATQECYATTCHAPIQKTESIMPWHDQSMPRHKEDSVIVEFCGHAAA